MDGIDYTPPTRQEREFLDWAMDKHEAKLKAEAQAKRERNAKWIAYCLKLLREESGDA